MKFITLALSLLVLCSCLPRSPKDDVIKSMSLITEENLELNDMNNVVYINSAGGIPASQKINPKKNLLFVALDQVVQKQYQLLIKKAYKSDEEVRIEDVAWWKFAPNFRYLYDYVVKIPYTNFTQESFKQAIIYLESLDKPYDIMMLAHAIPNHFITSQGHELLSYKDIRGLKDDVHKLSFVFLQSCFGSTLKNDFHYLGAKEVISYPSFNQNFFYIDFFIKNYKKHKYNIFKAYKKTNKHIQWKMRHNPLYIMMMKKMGISFDEYFSIAPNPDYSVK